jgi:hypothetical protein
MLTALQTFAVWRDRVERARTGAAPAVVWDIETPGLDPAATTLCVGFAQAGAPCIHWGSMLEAREFLETLEPGQLLVAHNAKYETQALIARGIDPRQFVTWDTMLGEWVLLANNPKGEGLNLDDTAQRYGCSPKDPEVDALIKAGRVLDVPQDKLMERNAKDVEDTRTVFLGQLARMTDAQIHLTIVRSMMCVELAHIELAGMGLDPERVQQECDRNAREVAEHELGLRDITKGANPRSVNEMAPVLYGIWPGTVSEDDKYNWTLGCSCNRKGRRKPKIPRTCPVCGATDVKGGPLVEPLGFKEPPDTRGAPSKAWPDGKPSIAKEVMELVAASARTPRQKLWAKHYAGLCEAISERDKNLAHFREVVANGAVIYAELHQGIAATHRLSCRSKPNPRYEYGCQLQNVPRHLKGCLVPKRKGWLAASVDQSQAEFRGAVFLGDDLQGRHNIADPTFDAHIQTLTVMLHGHYDRAKYLDLFTRYKAGDKEVAWQRADNKLCKGHTFKPLFGGSSGTDTERAYYKWFGQNYSGVTDTQNAWDREVQQTGRYVAPTGMVFHWNRHWQVDKWGRDRMVNHMGRSLYSIVRNLPIQYFATGELAMVSTLCLLYECRRRLLRYECVMLIHDDTSGEVHPEDVASWHDACGVAYGEQTHEFFREVYGINYDVELAAESKAGVRFGSGDKQEHAYTFPISDEDYIRMKISAKGDGGQRAPRVKVATHIALVQALVDLGVQPGSHKFPAPKRKIYLGFEFPNIQVEFKNEDGTVDKAPARLGRFMTASMHEKASYRKLVEALRGKKFASDSEASNFEGRTLLGMPCMVPVTHKQVAERTYENVGDPTPPLEGMTISATLAAAPLYYDTDSHDELAFKALPEFLQGIINGRLIKKDGRVAGGQPEAISGGLPDMGSEDGQVPF